MKAYENIKEIESLHGTPNNDEMSQLRNALIGYTPRFLYVGENSMSCNQCGHVKSIDKNEKRALKATKLCPNCYQEFFKTTIKAKKIPRVEIISFVMNGYSKAYRIEAMLDIKTLELTDVKYELVYYFEHSSKKFISRNVMKLSTYHQTFTTSVNKEWKERSQKVYGYESSFLVPVMFREPKTRKEYLESFNQKLALFKPNQIHLIKNNHLTKKMIYTILTFDLDHLKDIYKYASYANSHDQYYAVTDGHQPYMIARRMKVNLLRYLSNQSITLNDYCDYVKQCEDLKIRLVKYPKDFHETHQKLAKALKAISDKQLNENIEKFRNKLPKYQNDKYIIEPFGSVEELIIEGDTLGICIGMDRYAKGFSNGEKWLYKVRKKDEKEVPLYSVEISPLDFRIVQARTKHNKNAPEEIMKLLKIFILEAFETKKRLDRGRAIL